MATTENTKTVQYVGTADARNVGKVDFAAAGLEDQANTTFYKGRDTELPEAAANVLLTHELFAGEFIEVTAPGV